MLNCSSAPGVTRGINRGQRPARLAAGLSFIFGGGGGGLKPRTAKSPGNRLTTELIVHYLLTKSDMMRLSAGHRLLFGSKLKHNRFQ